MQRPGKCTTHTVEAETIHDQGTGAMNEDAVRVNGTLFGVFDGATSLNGKTFDSGATGGYLAATTAGDIFSRNDGPLMDLAHRANAAIRCMMLENGVDVTCKENLWSTSAAVGRIEGDRFHWVQSGDSPILAIYEDGSCDLLATGDDHDLETLKLWKETAASRTGSILDELKDQIRKVRSGMNITYGVMNGEAQAMDFLNHGSVSLEGIKHILLFTDGLFIPREDPEAGMDFKTLVSLFLAGGLQAVKHHVRSVEHTDPGCRRYPRFKTHDDMAAIALSFSSTGRRAAA
ncbi:protein phosphatase 2C domain-containing protein [Desulfoluna spongiiphila]|uniref:Protein phosphatase 2C n=1 Tax=Desulfoluna spongiiphila TaxID=419481 RepID=A0A1G5G9N0_9BACT|nr:protein phosphatase 2C domain-containing protein [Desulfoluna spongiiphila]SCY48204.1 Protein phosphatase 2C [Desulfoluna spongiiphila]